MVIPTNDNIIRFITIASTGDAQDFGDFSITAAAKIAGVYHSQEV